MSPSSTGPATLDDAARARVPEEARAHTPHGAEAFARFYLEQVNQAWMVPDPDLIRPYALESCKTCANYVQAATWLADHVSRYDGEAMVLGPSVVAPETKGDHIVIEMGANQARRNLVSRDGSVERRVEFRPAGAQLHVLWRGDSWLISEIKVIL